MEWGAGRGGAKGGDAVTDLERKAGRREKWWEAKR